MQIVPWGDDGLVLMPLPSLQCGHPQVLPGHPSLPAWPAARVQLALLALPAALLSLLLPARLPLRSGRPQPRVSKGVVEAQPISSEEVTVTVSTAQASEAPSEVWPNQASPRNTFNGHREDILNGTYNIRFKIISKSSHYHGRNETQRLC